MNVDVDDIALFSFELASEISNKMLLIRHYINTDIDIESFNFDDIYTNSFMKWLSKLDDDGIDLKKKSLAIAVERIKTKIESYGNYMEHEKSRNDNKQREQVLIDDIKHLRDFIQNLLGHPDRVVKVAQENVEKVKKISNESFVLDGKNVKVKNKIKVNID